MIAALVTQDAARSPVVRIVGGEVMADSRDVSRFFGKRHDDVLRAVRNANCSTDFRARNFAETQELQTVGAVERLVPLVQMTKNGFAFVAMGFTGAKAGAFKEAYILQFDAMEAELRRQAAPAMVPQTLPEALRLAADLAEENERHKRLLIEVQPKADALDRIATAEGSLCVTDAAKVLQIKPRDLFGFLRSNGWLYRRPGCDTDVASQRRLDDHTLESKVVTYEGTGGVSRQRHQVRVTPKGIKRLSMILTAKEPARLV